MSLGLKWNILWLIYSRRGTGSACGVWESARRPGRRLPHPICHPAPFTNSVYHQHDVFKQRLQKGSLFDPPLLSLSLISPIKIVCATNPSCIAGTLLASKYNPNVNSLELRAPCQEMNNLCEAKQTVYWRGGVGCRWGAAGLRRRQARPEGHQSCFCQKTRSHVICFLSLLTQLRVKLLILPGSSARAFQQAGEADVCVLPISTRPLCLCVAGELWVRRSRPPGHVLASSLLDEWGKWGDLEINSGISPADDWSVAGLLWWNLNR